MVTDFLFPKSCHSGEWKKNCHSFVFITKTGLCIFFGRKSMGESLVRVNVEFLAIFFRAHKRCAMPYQQIRSIHHGSSNSLDGIGGTKISSIVFLLFVALFQCLEVTVAIISGTFMARILQSKVHHKESRQLWIRIMLQIVLLLQIIAQRENCNLQTTGTYSVDLCRTRRICIVFVRLVIIIKTNSTISVRNTSDMTLGM